MSESFLPQIKIAMHGQFSAPEASRVMLPPFFPRLSHNEIPLEVDPKLSKRPIGSKRERKVLKMQHPIIPTRHSMLAEEKALKVNKLVINPSKRPLPIVVTLGLLLIRIQLIKGFGEFENV